MHILIEEYQYNISQVRDVLYGIDALENVEGRVSIHYVGYYYNSHIKDTVFILPKVLLEDKYGKELVFGKYLPEDIAHVDGENQLTEEERRFIYKFAVWVYRAIVVYKNDKANDTDIIYHTTIMQVGQGQRRKSNTYLDILLSLIQFGHEHRQFFFYVVKNQHSGLNKINWTRTIAKEQALLQDGCPVYVRPVNKRKQINFDEELLVIYFSIINYIADTYGFEKNILCQYQLITGKRFETYLNGMGKRRLRQIKYKYFSDTVLKLWHLCYAFFDESQRLNISTNRKEYLLAKNFYMVFEAIIDELIGDKPLPDGMGKKQEDGKIVDHLFTARSLIDNEQRQTYYIGDSKYYKMGHELGSEAVYKQYTYARNVIQWNLDIFNQGKVPASGIVLRDDLTEGYHIIPNFFISSKMDEQFDYSNDGIEKTNRRKNRHKKVHFSNRLFDRDTLLLFHYDVNFLFVLSLYARNNKQQKAVWKEKVRDKFRTEIQDWLQQDYKFYAMRAHPDVDARQWMHDHFKDVVGKVYTPYTDKSVYSLAHDTLNDHEAENQALVAQLQEAFYVAECRLGQSPDEVLPQVIAKGVAPQAEPQRNGVLMVMMEQYERKSQSFLSHGRLAVGIKYTKQSMEIVEHLSEIGYVLFHQRRDEGQHLFAVKGTCEVRTSDEIEANYYKITSTTDLYVIVDIEATTELDASQLHSGQAEYTKDTRYDAQWETLNLLSTFIRH